MFKRDLDRNGTRWVQERSRVDTLGSRTAGRDIGLPPPSKFTSGRLPSRVFHLPKADESASVSDDEMSVDSDEDGYHKSVRPLDGRRQSASDYVYSDVSSSVETTREACVSAAERLAKLKHMYPVKQSTYTDDELTDSSASSECSSTQVYLCQGMEMLQLSMCRDGLAAGR